MASIIFVKVTCRPSKNKYNAKALFGLNGLKD